MGRANGNRKDICRTGMGLGKTAAGMGQDQTGNDKLVLCNTLNTKHCLQCFDAVGWAAGRASGL